MWERGRGFSLAEHSNKPCAFVGGRDAACIGFAHPLISMARNKVIGSITQGARNDDADV